jgi:post-segregation antitoxin (ccd killing protein)
MAKLADILAKDITRSIDGVIKADDEAHIVQELEEYVLTNEVAKQLERMVSHYLEAIEKGKSAGGGCPFNGVWISGYFGSGKSHLLKMLAYLLEDAPVGGKRLSPIFLPKIQDQFLKANLQNALKAPATSILFNIDQLADSSRGHDENAMLYIFEKALNRMLGYYHENRAIAEFERHLDEEGSYAGFQDHYKKTNNASWQESRAKAFGLNRNKLVSALASYKKIPEEDARSLIDHYKNEAGLSIEGFAGRIKTWLDGRKDPQHRLNFFVDEVGQFIADNTRLMLNLQTIAETLATVCRGRDRRPDFKADQRLLQDPGPLRHPHLAQLG